MRSHFAVTAILPALLAACTSHDPLYRSEADIPARVLVSAAESDAPEDAAALLLLADLAAHHGDLGPGQETLATVLEALATRLHAGTLSPVQRLLAEQLAAGIALDDGRDAAVRMNACDVLVVCRDRAALARVVETAIDPLVAEHAAESLDRLDAPSARP